MTITGLWKNFPASFSLSHKLFPAKDFFVKTDVERLPVLHVEKCPPGTRLRVLRVPTSGRLCPNWEFVLETADREGAFLKCSFVFFVVKTHRPTRPRP